MYGNSKLKCNENAGNVTTLTADCMMWYISMSKSTVKQHISDMTGTILKVIEGSSN